jgi:hypothetical protein
LKIGKLFRFSTAVATASALVSIGYVWQQSAIREFDLSHEQVQLERGKAHTLAFSHKAAGWPIFTLSPQEAFMPCYSNLRLLIAGREVGPSNVLHQEIRDMGGGRYSLWGNTLYFSTPDGTDPRMTAQSFRLTIKPFFSTIGFWVVCLVAFTFVWASGLLSLLLQASFKASLFCDRHRQATCFALGLVFFIALMSLLYSNWQLGKSTGLALASYYPISDASVYWIGAHDLLSCIARKAYITPALEHCQTRIIYATLLSGISIVCKGSLSAVLIIQVMLSSLALLLLLRSCRQILGWLGCCSVVVFLGVYVARHLMGQTMTENAGFIFGVSGVAFLIDYSIKNKWFDLLIGLSFLSIGLSSRAGAVLVLPALFLWAILYLPQRSPKRP